jgi:hypothetical protein
MTQFQIPKRLKRSENLEETNIPLIKKRKNIKFEQDVRTIQRTEG